MPFLPASILSIFNDAHSIKGGTWCALSLPTLQFFPLFVILWCHSLKAYPIGQRSCVMSLTRCSLQCSIKSQGFWFLKTTRFLQIYFSALKIVYWDLCFAFWCTHIPMYIANMYIFFIISWHFVLNSKSLPYSTLLVSSLRKNSDLSWNYKDVRNQFWSVLIFALEPHECCKYGSTSAPKLYCFLS